VSDYRISTKAAVSRFADVGQGINTEDKTIAMSLGGGKKKKKKPSGFVWGGGGKPSTISWCGASRKLLNKPWRFTRLQFCVLVRGLGVLKRPRYLARVSRTFKLQRDALSPHGFAEN